MDKNLEISEHPATRCSLTVKLDWEPIFLNPQQRYKEQRNRLIKIECSFPHAFESFVLFFPFTTSFSYLQTIYLQRFSGFECTVNKKIKKKKRYQPHLGYTLLKTRWSCFPLRSGLRMLCLISMQLLPSDAPWPSRMKVEKTGWEKEKNQKHAGINVSEHSLGAMQ